LRRCSDWVGLCQVSAGDDEVLLALRFCFLALKDILFELSANDVANFKDVPPEVSQALCWPAFRDQYLKFRNEFIPGLLAEPCGRACWTVDAVIVRTVDGRLQSVGPSSVAVSVNDTWTDMSVQYASASLVGQEVQVGKGKGKSVCTLIGFEKHIVELSLYKLIMSQPYDRVRAAGVWHAIRMYHRLFMAGATTEALAELVGSLLTKQSRGGGGRKADLSDTIDAVRLRSHGVTGSHENRGFIGRSLNIYFRGKPWHFLVGPKFLPKRRDPSWGPSVAVHRYRCQFLAGLKFAWVRDEVLPLLRALGRRNLRDGIALDSKFIMLTPRAGYILQRARDLRQLVDALRVVAGHALPSDLDDRLWGLLGRTGL
jgi:hypothetical protein